MVTAELNALRKDIKSLKKAVQEIKSNMVAVEMIKAILLSYKSGPDPEGELTPWAKEQLEIAKETPNKDYISMEEIEKEFL